MAREGACKDITDLEDLRLPASFNVDVNVVGTDSAIDYVPMQYVTRDVSSAHIHVTFHIITDSNSITNVECYKSPIYIY